MVLIEFLFQIQKSLKKHPCTCCQILKFHVIFLLPQADIFNVQNNTRFHSVWL